MSKLQNNRSRFSGGQKTPGHISLPVLLSCYAASALIVVICLQERVRCIQSGIPEDGLPYLVLAVLGIAATVFISCRYFRERKAPSDRTQKK